MCMGLALEIGCLHMTLDRSCHLSRPETSHPYGGVNATTPCTSVRIGCRHGKALVPSGVQHPPHQYSYDCSELQV